MLGGHASGTPPASKPLINVLRRFLDRSLHPERISTNLVDATPHDIHPGIFLSSATFPCGAVNTSQHPLAAIDIQSLPGDEVGVR